MNKFAVPLLAGVAALVTGSAQAAPLSPTAPSLDNGIENVRTVCDEYGRCWSDRGSRRIIERDSYNYYGPRYRDRYRDRDYGRGPGVHLDVPGVSIGIGGGHRYR